jgi:Skp family chaperone for outer membrane proteins
MGLLMNKSFWLGCVASMLVIGGVVVGWTLSQQQLANAAPKAEAKPVAPLRAGHISASELMKSYKSWQSAAEGMNKKRQDASAKLIQLQGIVQTSAKQMEGSTGQERSRLEQVALDARRNFEDAERTAKAEIERTTNEELKKLFNDITLAIREMAEEKQLDAVYIHPVNPAHGLEESKANPQLFIDMMMRASAMQPIYLRDSVDLTGELLKRLNSKNTD